MPLLIPIDGWGFEENIDGKLAEPFEIEIVKERVEFASDVVGCQARALNGKYAGAYIDITPRHVECSGVVVLKVYKHGSQAERMFYGMADTEGLECSWK